MKKYNIPKELFTKYIEDYSSNESKEINIYLGKNETNNSVDCNIEDASNLIIIGDNKYGKTTLLNTIIASLIANYSPLDLGLILLSSDSFKLYNELPHIIKKDDLLKYICNELENRYNLFQKEEVYNINEYNKKVKDDKLQKIVVIIDDYEKSMSEDVNSSLVLILQKARAAGIYLILAINSNYVNNLPEVMLNNFTTSITFNKVGEAISGGYLYEEESIKTPNIPEENIVSLVNYIKEN